MSLMRFTTLTTTMARKPKRRKPRRKKKIVNATQSNDIPYSKYRIEWIDILSDSGWATDKEFDRMKLATPVNEGWLYSEDKTSIKVFASYDKDVDTNEITFGDRTMIPLACIEKMVKIK
jgi:hypothetical protein